MKFDTFIGQKEIVKYAKALKKKRDIEKAVEALPMI
jgi:hypothetical protein